MRRADLLHWLGFVLREAIQRKDWFWVGVLKARRNTVLRIRVKADVQAYVAGWLNQRVAFP